MLRPQEYRHCGRSHSRSLPHASLSWLLQVEEYPHCWGEEDKRKRRGRGEERRGEEGREGKGKEKGREGEGVCVGGDKRKGRGKVGGGGGGGEDRRGGERVEGEEEGEVKGRGVEESRSCRVRS